MVTTQLSALKFVTAAQPTTTTAVDPKQRRRDALCTRIDEQLALTQSVLSSTPYQPTRKVQVVSATGEKTTTEKAKKVRPWYWQSANKSFYVTIRYGATPLTFAKGANAVETNSLKGVLAVLQTVRTAVQNGELDDAIEQVVNKRPAQKAKVAAAAKK